MTPTTEERWREAQRVEANWWTPTAARIAEVRAGHAWLRDLLDITPWTVAGCTVTDIGGGPLPIVGHADLDLDRAVVVDPLPVSGWPVRPHVERVAIPAEHYVGSPTDEVWVYNVLQHVRDPQAVVAVVQAHALRRVRWFEYVQTPLEPHHPHTVEPDWLRAQFAEWIMRRSRHGQTAGHAWVACVWERPEHGWPA